MFSTKYQKRLTHRHIIVQFQNIIYRGKKSNSSREKTNPLQKSENETGNQLTIHQPDAAKQWRYCFQVQKENASQTKIYLTQKLSNMKMK